MGMDASKPFEAPRPQPDSAEIRDPDMLMIAHDHIGDLPFAGHQQGNLSVDFTGNGGNLAGYFVRDNFTGGYSTTVQILESLLLTGLQATCLTNYLLYSLSLWVC